MSRGPHDFKQGKVTKAVKAANKAAKAVENGGVRVSRVEIFGDKIVVFAGEPEQNADPSNRAGGEWD